MNSSLVIEYMLNGKQITHRCSSEAELNMFVRTLWLIGAEGINDLTPQQFHLYAHVRIYKRIASALHHNFHPFIHLFHFHELIRLPKPVRGL